MKIRNGFVTNSSSSSFVIVFKDVKTIEEEFERYRHAIGKDFGKLISDCRKKATPYNVAENPPLTKESFYDNAYENVSDMLERKRFNGDWHESWEWRNKHKDEFLDMVEKKQEELYKDFLKKIDKKGYCVEIEYSDHDTDLEYTLRNMPFVKSRTSYH